MASSDSSITTLLRPRVICIAVIAVVAAATVGCGLWHDSRRRAEQEEEIRRAAGSLHRSNAVRRTRRASTEPSNAQANGHDPSDDSLPDPLAGPGTDENAENVENAENAENAVTNAQAGAGGEPAEIVIGDAEADERWLDDMSQAVVHRAGQNIVSLLFRVSEDNARRSSYVHRGCACNACGMVPIRGIRYRCANCADFDLCETCESQGLHIKTHIFYKVKVPAPPFGPRQMQPVWYPGDPDTRVRILGKGLINRLSRETGFERQELEAFWEQWTYMANTEWREDPDELFLAMDRKTFERCLVPSGGYRHTAPNLIHDRMFSFYDTNNDDLIGFSEFLHGLSYRKRKDKLRKIFDGYDTDRDGYVSRRDFLRFFRAYYVLYKQMQKDILEGLDDQVMSSIETHQLVNGRQPLSSMFGREGRVPVADLQRIMAGKAINNQTGEIIVEDRPNGVVAEDSADTANREDLMARLFTRWSRHLTSSGMYEDQYHAVSQDDIVDALDDGLAASNYWDALLNPPAQVQDLPNLLIGQVDPSSQANIDDDDDLFVPNAATYRNDTDVDADADGDDLHWVGMDSASERPHAFQDASRSASGTSSPSESPDVAETSAANDGSDTNDTNDGSANVPAHDNGHATRSDTSSHIRQRRNNIGGTGFTVLDGSLQDQYRPSDPTRRPRFNPRYPPTLGQLRAQYEASTRTMKLRSSKIAARRKLHNRWMRRNFYLDEEEGATAPDQWRPESDILAGASISDAAGEPSSASRVRFTEGATAAPPTDEYENQPSPSSSARTVLPDAWGGDSARYGDIPEAERDAGREILYQVMQQSFNEMLDTLFVEKEDLAIAAAETKDKRDQYRHLFENIDLVREWAENGEAAGQQDKTNTASARGKMGHRSSGNETIDTIDTINRPLEQLDLEDLLNMAGYQVDENAGTSAAVPETQEANDAEPTAGDRLVREGAPEPESEAGDVEATAPETQLADAADAAKENEGDDEEGGTEEEKDEEEGETSDKDSNDKDSDEKDSDDKDSDEEQDSPAQVQASAEPRDWTLPQFRPNTEAEYRALLKAQSAATAKTTTTTNLSATVEDEQADEEAVEAAEAAVKANGTGAEPKGKEKEKAAGPTATTAAARPQSPDIPRSELVRWKRLDMAEREAHVRGGWGKLSYSEFEAIFRREELKNNRLDYLGSWIDFCIP